MFYGGWQPVEGWLSSFPCSRQTLRTGLVHYSKGRSTNTAPIFLASTSEQGMSQMQDWRCGVLPIPAAFCRDWHGTPHLYAWFYEICWYYARQKLFYVCCACGHIFQWLWSFRMCMILWGNGVWRHPLYVGSLGLENRIITRSCGV